MARAGALVLALLAASAPGSRGQELVRKWTGATAFDYFGSNVGWAGDINADGFVDIAIAAPRDSTVATYAGMIEVVSGADGAVLQRFYGDMAWTQLSGLGSPLGDLDGDGYDDLLASESLTWPLRRLFVFSGKDGSTLMTLDGTSSDTLWGHFCGMGDVDGDGVPDFAVSSSDSKSSFIDVISGATRSAIYQLRGANPSSYYFGDGLVCPGDLDGDGTGDLIVIENSSYYSSQRYDYAFSGRTGALIWQAPGRGFDSGLAPTVIGDVNGDGVVDWVMGWNYYQVSGGSYGGLECFSGKDGSRLFYVLMPGETWGHQGTSFGEVIAATGDVNGDGTPDVAASDDEDSDDPGGDVYFFSGVDGELLFHTRGTYKSYRFGTSLVGGIDVDQDGHENLVVGDDIDTTAGIAAGAASLLRFDPIVVDANPRYRPYSTTTITVLGGPPSNPFAMFLVDWGGTPMFDLVAFSTFDGSRRWQHTWNVPAGFSGIDVTLRAYAIDASGGLVVSNDETIRLQ